MLLLAKFAFVSFVYLNICQKQMYIISNMRMEDIIWVTYVSSLCALKLNKVYYIQAVSVVCTALTKIS